MSVGSFLWRLGGQERGCKAYAIVRPKAVTASCGASSGASGSVAAGLATEPRPSTLCGKAGL